jgi:hypothetical protein
MSGEDQRSFLSGLIGDGRPLLALTGTALFLSAGFGILQSISGYLLPHDSHAIGMDASRLLQAANNHVVHFMFHDRVAFCGTLLAIGSAYWWLAEFPLKAGREWAWWAYLISGSTGFLSFLVYLKYGYLDTWHAWATLLLLPTFLVGLIRARSCIPGALNVRRVWFNDLPLENAYAKTGRLLLQACAAGLILAGVSIVAIGMTVVFVPQDLAFMQFSRERLQAISPMLIPVIAHDRSGFGGGLLSAGLLIAAITRNAILTRSFVEVIGIMGFCGFGAALGVHVAIGYLDFVHLAPAYAGCLLFLSGWALCVYGLRLTHSEFIAGGDGRVPRVQCDGSGNLSA